MRLGIFGGTFDPIHNGHVLLAERFALQLSLDRLFIIPDSVPPHKAAGKDDNPQLRLEMTRLAFEGRDLDGLITVSDTEIMRGGKSYTIDTLKEFEGKGELFLLCGTDMLIDFDSWRSFDKILKMCTVVVGLRSGSDVSERGVIDAKIRFFEKEYGARITVLGGEPYPASSTEIRKMIGRGEDASSYVPAKVWKLIREKGLYI